MAETNAVTTAPKTPEPAPAPKPVVRSTGTRATAPTNQADMSPQDRWLADQAAADARDPQRNPNIVLTKDAAGNLVARERVIGDDGEARAGKLLDQPDNPPGDITDQPAPDAGTKYKFGEIELSEAEIRSLMEHKAQEDLRKTTIPPQPSDYKLELPKDFKLPPGVQFTVANINDPVKGPALVAAQGWAHRNNLSQAQFSELLGLYGASQASEQIMLNDAAAKQRELLGPAGPTRVDAIATWLRARYGDAAARPMLNTMLMESQVRIWEDIITRATNGGSGGSYSSRGREAPEARTISDEQWNKMSYHQQVEYAREATARAANNGRR